MGFGAFLVGLGMWLGYLISRFMAGHVAHHASVPPLVWRDALVGIAMIVAGGLLIVQGRRGLLLERARQEAAQGRSDRVVSVDAPGAVATREPLAMSIRLRPAWPRVCGYLGAVVLAVSLVPAVLLPGAPDLRPEEYAFSYVALASLLVALYLVALLDTHQRIEADDGVLKVWTLTGPRTMRWEDARLFAVVPPGRRGAAPIRYELASRSASVRWIRISTRARFLPWIPPTATKPVLPAEEYNRQMDALVAAITEKTSLHLYDLR